MFAPRQVWMHSSMTVLTKVEKVAHLPSLFPLPLALSLPSMSVSGYQQLAVVGVV